MLRARYSTAPPALDTRGCEQLVPSDPDLRRVKPCVDFARCRDLVKDGYRPAMGRTADDPVRMLMLACRPCHDHRSDRAVLTAVQVKVACRCLLDLALERRLPGPSVLAPLRTR
jgi:hypothetical protein